MLVCFLMISGCKSTSRTQTRTVSEWNRGNKVGAITTLERSKTAAPPGDMLPGEDKGFVSEFSSAIQHQDRGSCEPKERQGDAEDPCEEQSWDKTDAQLDGAVDLALDNVSPEQWADKTFVLRLLQLSKDIDVLPYASDELRADKEVVLEAVKHSEWALENASEELQGDRDVVLEAVRFSGFALEYASPELQADKYIVLEAVKKTGASIGLASDELRANKEVVFVAVKQDGRALRAAADKLRGDRDVVIEAVKQTAKALKCASRFSRANKDLVLLAARCCKDEADFRVMEACKAEAGLFDEEHFWQAVRVPIAVQGEEGVPVLSVRISLDQSPNPESQPELGPIRKFRCEVSLLSGANFCFWLPETTTGAACNAGSSPTLKDLAANLVEEVPKHTGVKNAKRFFIMLVMSDDGDSLSASPWDCQKPLANFLAQPK